MEHSESGFSVGNAWSERFVDLVLAACDESDDQGEISALVDGALRGDRPLRDPSPSR